MSEIRVDALGLLAQLGEEIVSDFEITIEDAATVEDIVDALLAFQVNANPITKGTIEYTDIRAIEVPQDTILGALIRLRESVGGYIFVDNDRKLHWLKNIGENKGQQIRYKKNLKGITRSINFSDFANRIYCFGAGEGEDRVRLGNLVTTPQVAANTDDCTKSYSSGAWSFHTSGGFELVVGNWVTDIDSKYGSGMRFICPVPAGSTILEAYLVLVSHMTAGGQETEGVKTKIRGEKSVNAATFSDLADYDARPRTDAVITWDDILLYENNVEFWSPDISTIIQEIIDQDGYAANNGMAIFWDDHEGRSTAVDDTIRRAYSYNHSPTFAPKLYIYYISPDPVDYVEDIESQLTYGDGVDPLKGIVTKMFIDKSITDQDTLAEWANLKLLELKDPYISYSIDVVNLAAIGWTFETLTLGNIVKVVDEDLGIDVSTRIVKLVRNLTDPLDIKIEVANISKDIIAQLGRDFRWRQQFY
jgi:hypothetical protein